MRKRIGIVCLLLGALCLLGAIGFALYNRWESESAAQLTQSILADAQSAISREPEEQPQDDIPMPTKDEKMATVPVGGYDCIGILSIPVLDLELPVLTDWSYEKLKKAPCHYYGAYDTGDFVIAAHNYQAHFGRLSALQPGDAVVFTDATGVAHIYQVVLLETLPKEATAEMITSGFDLSLYTCTPGGGNRVTVRCSAAS